MNVISFNIILLYKKKFYTFYLKLEDANTGYLLDCGNKAYDRITWADRMVLVPFTGGW